MAQQNESHQDRYPHLANWDTMKLVDYSRTFKFSKNHADPTFVEARQAIAAELQSRGVKDHN